MADLHKFSEQEANTIIHSGMDSAMFTGRTGIGDTTNTKHVDVTSYHKVIIQTFLGVLGASADDGYLWGISFTANAGEDIDFTSYGSGTFFTGEYNKGLYELTIPTHIDSIEIDREGTGKLYMNLATQSINRISYWLM